MSHIRVTALWICHPFLPHAKIPWTIQVIEQLSVLPQFFYNVQFFISEVHQNCPLILSRRMQACNYLKHTYKHCNPKSSRAVILKVWFLGSNISTWQLFRNAITFGPTPDLLKEKLSGMETRNLCYKFFRWFWCILKFENHWSRWLVIMIKFSVPSESHTFLRPISQEQVNKNKSRLVLAQCLHTRSFSS